MGATSKKAVRTEALDHLESHQYLMFMVADEMYAIGILNIKEIIEYANVTSVPMMPVYIRGVINLRGSVVPVIDLGSRFGHSESEVSKRTCIVILEMGTDDERHDIGIVVDSVSEVLDVADLDIEQAPPFGVRIRTDFITGMAEIGGRFVVVLNVERVLAVDEMSMVAAIAQGGVEAGGYDGTGTRHD
jgi:purine-binding chemotaxis protein CheW